MFQRLGIPYCCEENKTLKEACREAGIRLEILEQFYAEAARRKAKEVHSFEKLGSSFLADYILQTHHSYIKENREIIEELTAAALESSALPEMEELAERLSYFLSALSDHLQKEEELLFPQIRKLTESRKRNRSISGTVYRPLEPILLQLEKEHQQLGNELMFIRKLTRNYRLPAYACDSCTHLYAKLLEFENDLVQHIHLENNLLFPKALSLEKELMSNSTKIFTRQACQSH